MLIFCFFLFLLSPFFCKIIAYYGNWKHYQGYPICFIPLTKVDILSYNFVHTDSGTCRLADEKLEFKIDRSHYANCPDSFWPEGMKGMEPEFPGNYGMLLLIKKMYPKLKIMASIAGGAETHDVMLTDSSRQYFMEGCMSIINQFGSVFDGIDIDIEYPCLPEDQYCGGITPSADDKGSFSKLMKLFKDNMEEKKLLSVCINLDKIKIDAMDYNFLNNIVDFYNIMSYNIADGAWSSYTGHHAQVYGNPDDPIEYRRNLHTFSAATHILTKGVPPSKIYLGACFYGRGFSISSSSRPSTVSPFVKCDGDRKDLSTVVGEPNIFFFYDIVNRFKNPTTYFYDEVAQAPYILDWDKGVYISYEDEKSVQKKVDLVNELNLGGIFIWEVSSDRTGVLVDIIYNGLIQSQTTTENNPTPTQINATETSSFESASTGSSQSSYSSSSPTSSTSDLSISSSSSSPTSSSLIYSLTPAPTLSPTISSSITTTTSVPPPPNWVGVGSLAVGSISKYSLCGDLILENTGSQIASAFSMSILFCPDVGIITSIWGYLNVKIKNGFLMIGNGVAFHKGSTYIIGGLCILRNNIAGELVGKDDENWYKSIKINVELHEKIRDCQLEKCQSEVEGGVCTGREENSCKLDC